MATKDEPCHIAADGGKYLCYDCLLTKAKRPARAQPLPGVLEHSEENL